MGKLKVCVDDSHFKKTGSREFKQIVNSGYLEGQVWGSILLLEYVFCLTVLQENVLVLQSEKKGWEKNTHKEHLYLTRKASP